MTGATIVNTVMRKDSEEGRRGGTRWSPASPGRRWEKEQQENREKQARAVTETEKKAEDGERSTTIDAAKRPGKMEPQMRSLDR